MPSLEGLTVVLTGAAGGLGRPVARRLGEAGAKVTGIDLAECVGCAHSLIADLSDDSDLALTCARLEADPPDILINLAGIMRFGLHELHTTDALALCYRVNLIVPAALASAVAGSMRARGSGQIVNIGSMLGAIPYPWFAAYSSSKAGLAALSQALRRELDGSGVAVTHISPRAARTAFNHGEVERFLAQTGIKADEPEWVAGRIVAAIAERRGTVNVGTMERVYAALNALAPGIIDGGLRSQLRRVRHDFE